MSMTKSAAVYGEALYGLARDEGVSQRILEEMTALNGIFSKNSEYLRLLSAPSIPKQERCRLLDEAMQGVHPYLLNFLKILTERGSIGAFSGCCESYRALYNEANNILPVKAVTAVPMSDELKARLTARLEQVTGKQVELTCKVDQDALGGVRLDLDGKRLDGTVRHRIDEIRGILKNTVL